VERPSSSLPERRLALGFVWRGCLLWVLARSILLAVQVAGGGTLPPALIPPLTPAAALGVVLAVGGLGMLESRRLNEHRFLANLGVSPAVVALLVMLPAVCGEILAAVMSRG